MVDEPCVQHSITVEDFWVAHGCSVVARISAPQRTAVGGAFVVLLLTGCGNTDLVGRPHAGQGMAPEAVQAPTDPVVAFAARAQPGATELLLDAGRPVRATLVRAYHAASGRDCRQVQLDTGAEMRLRLVCSEGGRWAEARPLLRGSGAARR
jgi:hypothetical protein